MTTNSQEATCRLERRRHRSGFAAAAGVLLVTAITATAAAHGNRPPVTKGGVHYATTRSVNHGFRHGFKRGLFNVTWGSRYPVTINLGYRQHDHGYAAGQRAGWWAGYNAAKFGRVYRPSPSGARKGSFGHLGRDYLRGFADAYHRGYRQRQREGTRYGCRRY